MTGGEAAVWNEILRFPEGTEDAVPQGDVAVVEPMHIKLMMDGMMLRSLQEISEPSRRAEIAVVEVFAENGEDVEPCAASGRCAEQRKHERAGKDGIRGNFDGVFIEGGQEFDA